MGGYTMSNQPAEDQATRLRTRVENMHQSRNHVQKALPPRKEFHQNKKQKTKWKISFPLIRLLVIVFIVIILLFLTIKFWGEGYLSSAETSATQDSFDQVKIKLQSSNEHTDYQVHTVANRESLFSISKQYYGSTDYVQEIIDVNEISDKGLVVGQKLIIPIIEKD